MAVGTTDAGLLAVRMKDAGSLAAVIKDVAQWLVSTAEVATTALAARMVEADPTAAGTAADTANALGAVTQNPHPCAQNAQGWGTLECLSRVSMKSRPT